MAREDRLLTTFRFEVTFDRAAGTGPQKLGDGGFQEVTGLEVEMDVSEHAEGGRNDGTIRLLGPGYTRHRTSGTSVGPRASQGRHSVTAFQGRHSVTGW